MKKLKYVRAELGAATYTLENVGTSEAQLREAVCHLRNAQVALLMHYEMTLGHTTEGGKNGQHNQTEQSPR